MKSFLSCTNSILCLIVIAADFLKVRIYTVTISDSSTGTKTVRTLCDVGKKTK